MQSKTTTRHRYMPMRMAKIPGPDNTKCWQGYGARGTLIHCGFLGIQQNWAEVQSSHIPSAPTQRTASPVINTTEHRIPGVNRDKNYGLWVTMVHWGRFISYNHVHTGGGVVPSAQICLTRVGLDKELSVKFISSYLEEGLFITWSPFWFLKALGRK